MHACFLDIIIRDDMDQKVCPFLWQKILSWVKQNLTPKVFFVDWVARFPINAATFQAMTRVCLETHAIFVEDHEDVGPIRPRSDHADPERATDSRVL
jgi:hypothetical protein